MFHPLLRATTVRFVFSSVRPKESITRSSMKTSPAFGFQLVTFTSNVPFSLIPSVIELSKLNLSTVGTYQEHVCK